MKRNLAYAVVSNKSGHIAAWTETCPMLAIFYKKQYADVLCSYYNQKTHRDTYKVKEIIMKKVIVGDGQFEREAEIEYKEITYDIGKESRWHLGETEFDGHHVLWGFEYFPTTYLKSSGLSGDEWRKGGEIRYFKNRKQCYSEFCRDPKIAALKIGETLLQLIDFPWENVQVGRKVYFEKTPAVVYMILEDQGCVVLKTEDGKNFPDAIWKEEDSPNGEREDTLKVEILSPSIWWYRK